MYTTIPFALALTKMQSGRRVELTDGRKGFIVQSMPEISLATILTDEIAQSAKNPQTLLASLAGKGSTALVDLSPVHVREIAKIKQHGHGWVTVDGEKVTAE